MALLDDLAARIKALKGNTKPDQAPDKSLDLDELTAQLKSMEQPKADSPDLDQVSSKLTSLGEKPDPSVDLDQVAARLKAMGQDDSKSPDPQPSLDDISSKLTSMGQKPDSSVDLDQVAARLKALGQQDDSKSPTTSQPSVDTSQPSPATSQVLAAKLKSIGEQKAPEIIQNLSDKTGLKPEQVQQALPGVQSALRGAQVAQAQGKDPSKLGLAGLKAIDPANPGNGYPDYNKNLSQEHMIAGALSTLLPSLLSYAIAGPEGGKIAADASGKTAENFINNINTRRKLEQHQFERNQDIDYRNRHLKVQEKGVLGKKNYQERALSLQEQIAGNKDQNEKQRIENESQKINNQLNNPIKPTKLSPAQVDQVTGFNTAYKMMDDLEKTVNETPHSFGRWNRIGDSTKFNNAKLNALDSKLEKVGLQIGMAAQGKALTQEEANYWKGQFTRSDTDKGIKEKLNVYREMIKEREKSFHDAVGMNKQPMPGYTPKADQPGTEEAFPGVDESAIKEQMEKNDLTRDQVIQLLKKRAEKNGK